MTCTTATPAIHVLRTTATLAIHALRAIENALRNGVYVNANALEAVNAGLTGLIVSGMEPTDAQRAAVAHAIGNLTIPGPVAPEQASARRAGAGKCP